MFHKLADSTASFFLDSIKEKQLEKSVIVYGLEVLISSTVNIIIALVISILFHNFIEVIIFLLFYCPMRQYTGGYHAKNYGLCTLVFTFMILTINTLDFVGFFDWNMRLISVAMMVYSIFIIMRFAPIMNENKILSKEEVIVYKKRARLLLGLDCMIIFILQLFGKAQISKYQVIALSCVSLLLVFEKMKGE